MGNRNPRRSKILSRKQQQMKLKDFKKGWLVGDFEPAIFRSKDIEVGIKSYEAGVIEPKHVHKITKEFTIVLSGRVKMLGTEYKKGDVVFVDCGIENAFQSITKSLLLIIKTPSCPDDKYEVN